MENPFWGTKVEGKDALQDHETFQCLAIQPQKPQLQQVVAAREAGEPPEGRFSH